MSKEDQENMVRHMKALLRHMTAFNELMEKLLVSMNNSPKK